MTLNGIKLLKLMFREDETICLSDSQFAYHAIPFVNAISDKVTLVSPNDKVQIRTIPSDNITMVALNPIKGFREDANTYKYRNFLVEIDTGDLKSQLEYIKSSELPYSACIFSGNKSLHFLVSLEKDLPDEKSWRKISEWILNAIPLADPNTKNPSRSIRMPDVLRDGDPSKKQRLVELKESISFEQLKSFLDKHPDAKPKERQKRTISDELDISRIKTPWVCDALINGLDPSRGRNKSWFSISCEFALANYTEDDTIEILGQYFTPDPDFKEKEWLIAVRSGHRYIRNNRS